MVLTLPPLIYCAASNGHTFAVVISSSRRLAKVKRAESDQRFMSLKQKRLRKRGRFTKASEIHLLKIRQMVNSPLLEIKKKMKTKSA